MVGLGVEGPQDERYQDICWAYFAEKHLPFYRVTWLHNYSDKVVPDASKQWSLLIEVNQNSVPKDASEADVVALCEKAFRELGIIGQECQVVSRWCQLLKLSYPVPFLGRDELVEAVKGHLEKEYQIYTRGRFGDWIYEWTNQD